MPPVNQDRQLDLSRPAQVNQPIHGGADRPPGEQDVVHQNDVQVRHVERNRGFSQDGLIFPNPQVIAVERDVQLADRHLRAFDLLNPSRQPVCEVHPPGPDPDERDFLGAFIPLQNLVGDARQCPRHLTRIHHERFLVSGLFLRSDHVSQFIVKRSRKRA